MRKGRIVLAVAFAALSVASTTAAASAPKPAVAFDVVPAFVACRSGQTPVQVRASWRIVHPVTMASIAGLVDKLGNDLPPMVLSTKPTKRGVVGTTMVHLPCTAVTQTLTLTAVGPGGTTTRVATLNENRAD